MKTSRPFPYVPATTVFPAVGRQAGFTVAANFTPVNATCMILEMLPIAGFSLQVDLVASITADLGALGICVPDSSTGPSVVPLVTLRVLAPPSAVAAVAAATTAVAAASVVSAVAAGPAAAGDVQAFAVIGLLSCSNPLVRASAGSMRTLAPIAWGNTCEIVVAANVVLVGAVSSICVIIALIVKLRGSKKKNNKKKSFIDGCEMARFPGLGIVTIGATYQGTCFCGAQLMALGETMGSQTLGVIVSISCIILPIMVCTGLYKYVNRDFSEYQYTASDNFAGVWYRRILPYGSIAPKRNVRLFAGLAGSYRLCHPAMPVLPFLSPISLAVASLLKPSSEQGCEALFYVLAILHAGIAVSILAMRPVRFPLSNILAAVGVMCTACILVVSAAAVTDITVTNGRGVAMLMSSVGLIAVVRMGVSVLNFTLEMRVRRAKVPLAEIWRIVGDPLPSLSSLCHRAVEKPTKKAVGIIDEGGSPDPFVGAGVLMLPINRGASAEQDDEVLTEPQQVVGHAMLCLTPRSSSTSDDSTSSDELALAGDREGSSHFAAVDVPEVDLLDLEEQIEWSQAVQRSVAENARPQEDLLHEVEQTKEKKNQGPRSFIIEFLQAL